MSARRYFFRYTGLLLLTVMVTALAITLLSLFEVIESHQLSVWQQHLKAHTGFWWVIRWVVYGVMYGVVCRRFSHLQRWQHVRLFAFFVFFDALFVFQLPLKMFNIG